ncbi:hypothetical protein BGZ83_005478 [Gryganskiella cystojenkinii]|nr:hypothetical protein BGZ83_005478 [Gryganskiella cystojenkinii]
MAPNTMKAILLEQATVAPHLATLTEIPIPALEENQALIKVKAVSVNHRELWILKGFYPNITYGTVLGSDVVGHVLEANGPSEVKVGDRVIVIPIYGWEKDRRGPEGLAGSLGASTVPGVGVFSEYYTTGLQNLVRAPAHLTDPEAAALPLAGVTAYRAVFTKGEVTEGLNVLITGIGGGVALMALTFAVAVGANVYVTSSDDSKIQRAIELGAKGGVNYKEADWGSRLLKLTNGALIDVAIDGAGGDNTLTLINQLFRQGGILVNYGMTAKIDFLFTRLAFIKNIEIRGTTLGSRREFLEMVAFVDKHKVRPVISQVWEGLESVNASLDTMRQSSQFGKLVVTV